MPSWRDISMGSVAAGCHFRPEEDIFQNASNKIRCLLVPIALHFLLGFARQTQHLYSAMFSTSCNSHKYGPPDALCRHKEEGIGAPCISACRDSGSAGDCADSEPGNDDGLRTLWK